MNYFMNKIKEGFDTIVVIYLWFSAMISMFIFIEIAVDIMLDTQVVAHVHPALMLMSMPTTIYILVQMAKSAF